MHGRALFVNSLSRLALWLIRPRHESNESDLRPTHRLVFFGFLSTPGFPPQLPRVLDFRRRELHVCLRAPCSFDSNPCQLEACLLRPFVETDASLRALRATLNFLGSTQAPGQTARQWRRFVCLCGVCHKNDYSRAVSNWPRK